MDEVSLTSRVIQIQEPSMTLSPEPKGHRKAEHTALSGLNADD